VAIKMTTENYDALTFRYLQAMGAAFAEVLGLDGVVHPDLHRQIVEGLLARLAMSWEDQFIRDPALGGEEAYPAICFRDSAVVEEATRLVVSHPESNIYSYDPHDAADSLFGPPESGRDLEFVYGDGGYEEPLSRKWKRER
jgi:hypothetical protein